MKTVILGSGSWGTALAQVLADNEEDVLLYGRDEKQVQDINENHRNSRYFSEISLNPAIVAVHTLDDLKDADIVVLAVPTSAIEETAALAAQKLNQKAIFVNLAKGFHPDTQERMSQVIRRVVPEDKLSSVVSLVGPSHAEEVVERQLTSLDAISQNEEDAKTIQNVFSNDYLRVYTGEDEVGSELGAAVKNVMAIASGIMAGLGYKDNTRAALITRGLQEMIRFGMHFGANPQTFIGLTGIGDLIVTCSSQHSRNFQAGYQIGKENDVHHFLSSNTKTTEGVKAAKIVHDLAQKENIDMPICEEVYQILYEGKSPDSCARDLMLRELKKEF